MKCIPIFERQWGHKAGNKKERSHIAFVCMLLISAFTAGELLRGNLLPDCARLEALATMVRDGQPIVQAVFIVSQGIGEHVPV